MYPDERVASLINERFVPVKIHVKENPQAFERFGAQWTPTVIVAEADGTERYRFEGYLPPEDFVAQLSLGLARAQFAHGEFDEAEQRFRGIVERHPQSDAAAEALYWAGVSKYKRTGDGSALQETARAFQSQYKDSTWAKKSSVWAG